MSLACLELREPPTPSFYSLLDGVSDVLLGDFLLECSKTVPIHLYIPTLTLPSPGNPSPLLLF